MGKLTISRKSSLLGGASPSKVFIDGVEVNEITKNSSLELDVAEGDHTLKVGKSNDLSINVKEGEVSTYETSTSMTAKVACVVALVLLVANLLQLIPQSRLGSLIIAVLLIACILFMFIKSVYLKKI